MKSQNAAITRSRAQNIVETAWSEISFSESRATARSLIYISGVRFIDIRVLLSTSIEKMSMILFALKLDANGDHTYVVFL